MTDATMEDLAVQVVVMLVEVLGQQATSGTALRQIKAV